MTVASIKPAALRPSIGELVARAAEIRALVRAQAEQTEVNRVVSAEAIECMRDAGLFKIMQPAVYGGYEYGFDALVPVVAQVAAGCGSAGWVFSLGIVHQWLLGRCPGRRRTNTGPIQAQFRAAPIRLLARWCAMTAATESQATGASPAAATTCSGFFSAA